MGSLDEYLEVLGALPPEEQARLEAQAREATKDMLWIPNPGPQTDAFYCEADELLFGGEAGGGKSDLVIGLSLTAHHRSLVLRRTSIEAEKLFDRYQEILGHTVGKNKRGWRIQDRIIDIGGCQLEDDKQKRKGIAHDLKAFDELVDFTESQYLFITTWTRSTKPGQRTRIVSTTNPPTSPEGMWVVRRWAAWLDPKHPNPAKSGEIRWYTTINGMDTEVNGPGPHMVDGKEVMAKSRCFIRSRLDDNPDLTQTDDYQRTLDALPEELRAAYARGQFDTNLKDQAFQAIPSEWVRLAQQRWDERGPPGVPMCAIGIDCSGGGNDPLVLAPRFDGWFAPLIEIPGKDIPKDRPGRHGAGMIIANRRDNALVIVDMGGGYGGPIFEALNDNNIPAQPYKGAGKSTSRTADGQLGFSNFRTQAYWRLREALDPSLPGGSPIALPPNPKLMADLCAPTWRLKTGNVIELESKEDVCKRLGRSTDNGDAVVMSWSAGPTYLTTGAAWGAAAESGLVSRGPQSTAIMGRRR